MKFRFPFSAAVLACALLILSGGTAARAADAPDNSEVGLLRQTYHTLKIADHDYGGHRIKAMHEIEMACDLLGSNIRGDGKGEQSQTVSDDELRLAQQKLVHAHTMATEQKQKEVVTHLDEAVNQLARALGVK